MIDMSIPSKYLPGFTLISNLKNGDIEVLSAIFKDMPIGSKPDLDFSKVSPTFKYSKDEVQLMIGTIFSVLNLGISESFELTDIIEGLQNAYIKQSKQPDADNQLSQNLHALIPFTENFKINIKASALIREHDKVYSDSRIFSDLRYVFNHDKLTIDKKIAVIIHNLKIEYRKDDESHSLFIALSTDDLESLKKTIDRAIEKDKLIKASDSNQEKIIFVNL